MPHGGWEESVGSTLAEKIIARAALTDTVSPGDYVVLKDIVGPIIYSFKGFNGVEYLERLSAQVGVTRGARPERTIINGDHSTPYITIEDVLQGKAVREKAAKLGITKVYDRQGIGHAANVELGELRPGIAFVGFDPQSCYAGGIGAFYTNGGRLGSTAFEAYAAGEITICVPGTIKVEIDGVLPKHLSSRDVWFHIINDLGPAAAHGMVFEFSGTTVRAMDVEQRMVLCGNTAFAGSDGAIIASDDVTVRWFKDWVGIDVETIAADPDAVYAKVYRYRAEDFVSMVTVPPEMYTATPAAQLGHVKIDQLVMGTCAGGTLHDLRTAAGILKGRKLHRDVRMIVSPVTQKIFAQASNEGLLGTLTEAGAQVIAATCDVCVGIIAPLAPGEVCLSQQTVNAPGRSGSHEAHIYLASAATIAASAVTGYITDPTAFETAQSVAR